jgi:hypothetical protein
MQPVTSLDVRTQLTTALELDLIGPSNGHAFEGELLPEQPQRWYLTGFLVPVDADHVDRVDPTSDEEVAAEPPAPSSDDDASADRAAARKSPLPSSMGLSVLVPPGVERIEALAQWGDYHEQLPAPSDAAEPQTAASTLARGFRRTPRLGKAVISLAACTEKPLELPLGGTPEELGLEGMVLVVTVRSMAQAVTEGANLPRGTRAVSVFLVNKRTKQHEDAWTCFAFQASLTLSCEASFVPRPDLRSGRDLNEWDEQVADLQYRDAYEFAVGHGTSATWAANAASGDACSTVRTTWVPMAEVERVAPADIPDVERGMETLGALPDAAAAEAALMPLVRHYRAWIDAQRSKVAALNGPRAATASDMMALAADAARRIEEGIGQLKKPEALEAFRVANRAMATAARRRNWIGSTKDKSPEQLDAPTWRPFQLAFFLMTLRSIVEPEHADRDCVDLLFFPTGGGKTEAYLGLAAFTMVHRRLTHQGPLGCGVSVLMRYTLRLLTLDQLGRATGLVCALELERQANPKLGEWPFEIGLWVGKAATPNRMGCSGDKGPAVDDTAYTKVNQFRKDDKKPMPVPIEECPWCGDRFTRDSFWLKPNAKAPIDLHVVCTNAACAFSGDRHLPLVAVDEPVYRRLPAFIIATVDKFAALPWTGETGALFGLVDRHDENGFYGPCHPGRGKAMGANLPAPDLIIQDELHLISGPLGTIAGVYESAIDRLCTRTIEGKQIRPKIIASTATVRKAETQIRALFNRHVVTVFPPQGPDRRDSFFAVTEPSSKTPARLYVGLAAQGRSGKVLLLRAALALMSAGQKAYEAAGGNKNRDNPADPYMTLLGYFNSLRELGGTRRIVEDEIRTKLTRYGTMRRRIAPLDGLFADRDIDVEPLELTSRVSTDKVAEAKRKLGKPFPQGEKVDTALATNMISVGLDILRLGLMLVFSQPKTSAEYIQATSRVGRDPRRPGLVVTLLNAHKPRDRSHFERFGAFHASFYRSVEATSVTPFAPRALDRALAATLVALCRHTEAAMTPPNGAVEIRKHRNAFDPLITMLAERARDHAWPPTNDRGQGIHDAVRDRCNNLLDAWLNIANEMVTTTGKLQYQRDGDGPKLLRPFLDPELETFAPNADERKFRANRSMRDVEAAAELWLKELRTTGGAM